MTGPFLVSERLEFWRPRAEDLAGQIELVVAEETRRYLGAAQPTAHDQFERLMRNAGRWSLYSFGMAIIRLRGQADIIGNCGVFHSWRGFGKGMDDTPEMGWTVRHDHCGQGIAREAAQAMLEWFEMTQGPRRIACMIEDGNVASHRLAAGLGFVAYDRHEPEQGNPLILYERLP